jgi:hypothetical protein
VSKFSILQESRGGVDFLAFWDFGFRRFMIPLTADSLSEESRGPTARRSSALKKIINLRQPLVRRKHPPKAADPLCLI